MKYVVRNEAKIASVKSFAILAVTALTLSACGGGGGGGNSGPTMAIANPPSSSSGSSGGSSGGGSSSGSSTTSGTTVIRPTNFGGQKFRSSAGTSDLKFQGENTFFANRSNFSGGGSNSVFVIVEEGSYTEGFTAPISGSHLQIVSGLKTTYDSADGAVTVSQPDGISSAGPIDGKQYYDEFTGKYLAAEQNGKKVEFHPDSSVVDMAVKLRGQGFDPNQPITYTRSQYSDLTDKSTFSHSEVGLVAHEVFTYAQNSAGNRDDSRSSSSKAVGYVFGGDNPTDMSTVNKNVVANYNADFGGTRTVETGGRVIVVDDVVGGNATLTADFANNKVSGNITNLATTTGNLDYGIGFDASISGNKFSGSAGFTPSGSTSVTANSGGTVLGGFYGDNASEVAGVVQAYGPTPGQSVTNSDNTTISGAFQGKR